MITIKNLIKEFKIENKIFRAVDDVSLEIPTGCVYGIIGLSGAGKSTLVRCINRLEEATDGKIYIDDVCINELSEKELLDCRRNIGMIFQNFNLFNQKSVYENIAFPLRLLRMRKQEIDNRVEELLDFIDMKEKKYTYPSELSGGQKQRVAIARAIATKPKILLSDEGTSALDPANTSQILKLIKRAVDEFGMTVVMITHQMEVAREICDRVAVMENGRVIEENDAESIFKSPKCDLTRRFVDSLNVDKRKDNRIDFTKYKGKVVRISYSEDTADEPILSKCIKEYNVDANIITGNINQLSNTRVGYMYIEFIGAENNILSASEYLKNKGVAVEVVNE